MKAKLLTDGRIALANGKFIARGDGAYAEVHDFLTGKQDRYSDALRTYRTLNGSLVTRNLASGAVMFAEDERGPAKKQIALKGKTGDAAQRLLNRAKTQTVTTIAALSRQALARWLRSGRPDFLQRATQFFSPGELTQLQDVISALLVSGNLFGRHRLRQRLPNAPQTQRFAEDDFSGPLTPLRALQYFRSLSPLGKGAADYIGGDPLRRHAFTLSVDADKSILRRIQQALANAMATGKSVRNTRNYIDDILDEARVSKRQPGYSEMLARTNLISSMNSGGFDEFQDPDLADWFPAWQYQNISDGRCRPAHEALGGRIFGRGTRFEDVRGRDPKSVCNCRCTWRALDKADLAKELATGKQLESVPATQSFAESWKETKHPRDDAGRFGAVGQALLDANPDPGIGPVDPPGTGNPKMRAEQPHLAEAFRKQQEHAGKHHRWATAFHVNDLLNHPQKLVPMAKEGDSLGKRIARAKRATENADNDKTIADKITLFEPYHAQAAAKHPEGEKALEAARKEAQRRVAASLAHAKKHIAALPPKVREKGQKWLEKTLGSSEPDKFSEHVCYCDCSTRQCERRQNGHCSSGCACGSCLDDNWRRAAEKLKARS